MSTYTSFLLKTMGESGIYYTGQAGFIFKSKAGTTIGVDLYLSDCVERFDGLEMKRLSPKVVNPSDLLLDYVVATHCHLDHFDIDAMPFLMANHHTKLLAAKDCKGFVETLQLDKMRTVYMDEGDSIQCGDVTVQAVFCDHGTGAPEAVGLVINFDSIKIYIAGDTCLRMDKAPAIARYGPFDVMIAPINGAYGNLNETEAVQLCGFHMPKMMIPCHYWTFAGHNGDPGKFQKEIKEKLPGQDYLLMAAGEWAVIE